MLWVLNQGKFAGFNLSQSHQKIICCDTWVPIATIIFICEELYFLVLDLNWMNWEILKRKLTDDTYIYVCMYTDGFSSLKLLK